LPARSLPDELILSAFCIMVSVCDRGEDHWNI